MKLSLFRRKRYRGKGKSPEQKFKEKKARVDAYLMDTWLRQLKADPALAARIAEQQFGDKTLFDYGGDGAYSAPPDAIDILKQAKEIRDIVTDELGMSKGSWVKDLAEILRNLPAVLSSLNLSQLQNPQFNPQLRQVHQIPQPPKQEQPKSQRPDVSEVKLETLMSLLELSPTEALQNLEANNEVGWLSYLKSVSYEEFEATLKSIGEANPEFVEHISNFLAQKHRWLAELVELAHKNEQS